MKIDKTMTKLIVDVEYMIGNECFNPNSTTMKQDGTCVIGKKFRYPVHYYNPDIDMEWSTKSHIYSILHEDIKTMEYHFGANQLLIGNAIINTLEMLEKRYGIDFNQLEAQFQEKKNQSLSPTNGGSKQGTAVDRRSLEIKPKEKDDERRNNQ